MEITDVINNSAHFLPGTQKIHSVRPINEELLEVYAYSSTAARLERATVLEKSNIPFASIKGYCLTTYNNHCYLACVLKVKPESNEVRLSFLHPHGPAHSFVYPSTPNELLVDASDIFNTYQQQLAKPIL